MVGQPVGIVVREAQEGGLGAATMKQTEGGEVWKLPLTLRKRSKHAHIKTHPNPGVWAGRGGTIYGHHSSSKNPSSMWLQQKRGYFISCYGKKNAMQLQAWLDPRSQMLLLEVHFSPSQRFTSISQQKRMASREPSTPWIAEERTYIAMEWIGPHP